MWTALGAVLATLFAGSLAAVMFARALQSGKPTVFPPSEPRVGYQPSVCNRRSTLDIVLPCAATMVVCLYTAQHRNVPPKFSEKRGFWNKLRSGGWLVVLRNATSFVAGLVCPELIAFFAAMQSEYASQDAIFMREQGHLRWTRQLSFLAYMRGLQLDDGTLVTSGRMLVELQDTERGIPLLKLNYDAIADDIDDKSKADVLTKLLAIFQISRFFLDVVARRIERLPISPLEYITSSYVLSTLLVYIVWFDKPYGIQEPIHLRYPSRYFHAVESPTAPGTAKSKRRGKCLRQHPGVVETAGLTSRASQIVSSVFRPRWP